MIARVTAIVLVTLAVPAAAHAATVSVYFPPCAPEQSKYGQCYADEARFVAGAGEANKLTITRTSPPPSYAPLATFHDDGAPVVAGTGCKQVDDHTATCTGYNLVAIVELGDGDDSSTGQGSVSGGEGNDSLSGAVLMDGGPGDDMLLGSEQVESLTGGAGRDTIDAGSGDDVIADGGPAGERDVVLGGQGSDTIAYENRTSTVVVSLQQPAANEDQLTGIENLRGGAGDDQLVGDAGPNLIQGGPGRDQLLGLDGSDSLHGGTGADELSGGAGNDLLDPGPGRVGNSIACGAGNDKADPFPSTLIGADCESVGTYGFDISGTVRLLLPLTRPTAPVLSWDRPLCLDRPCELRGLLTQAGSGRRLGAFSFSARKPRSKLPRRLVLRLSPAGRRIVSGRNVIARVLITSNDGGDRDSQSFLIPLNRG